MKNPNYILVTGGEGFVGRSVCAYLLRKKKRVVSIDNLSNSKRKNFHKNISFFKVNIKEKREIEKIFKQYKFETVIHLAAKIDARESNLKKNKYYLNNFVYGKYLVNISKKYNTKYFLFASSAAVYGSYKSSFKEKDKKKPINMYGKYKLLFEKFLSKSKILHANLRFFNICGANTKFKLGQLNNTGVIKKLYNSQFNNKPFYIYGNDFLTKDGYGVRDYLHIDDLNNIIYRSLTYLKNKKKNLTINCGSGNGVSIKELLDHFPKKNLKLRIRSKIDGDPSEVISKIELLKARLDYKPRYSSIKNILKSSMIWEQFINKNKF